MRLAILVTLCVIAAAHADPPARPAVRRSPLVLEPVVSRDWKRHRATVEWSTWLRAGYGVHHERPELLARGIVAPQMERTTGFEGALGADVTYAFPTSRIRIGGWAELRGLTPVGGAELLIAAAPRNLDMFFYSGEGVLAVRAGAGRDQITAAVAWGYRCPWTMFDPAPRDARYMIGARLVATATQSTRDADDWSMTLGLEVEPIGALRYLLGVRSWY